MKGAWAKIAVMLVSCSICVALGELAVRLFLPPPQIVHVRTSAGESPAPATDGKPTSTLSIPEHPNQARGGFYYLTSSGRRLRPNTVAVVQRHATSGLRVELETNSIGYRNREIGPKRGTRLLFLGDSITLGAFLPEGQTFVRLVEQLARADGREWETINAGVSGISLQNELAILAETGLSLEPDLVVVGFYLNDFKESLGVYVAPLPLLLQRSRLLYYLLRGFYVDRQGESRDVPDADRSTEATIADDRRRLNERQRDQVATWKAEFVEGLEGEPGPDAFFGQVIERFDDWGGAWSPHAWERMRPLFGELQRLSEAHGFRVVVVAFPVRHQVEARATFDDPQRRLREVCDELGFPMLDLLPVLRRDWQATGTTSFYDHCHPTAEGNALIARQIYGFLAERF